MDHETHAKLEDLEARIAKLEKKQKAADKTAATDQKKEENEK